MPMQFIIILRTAKPSPKVISACKKTQCLIRKRQVQGLRSQKKRSLLFVNEHFSDKRNEEIGVFLLTLINEQNYINECKSVQVINRITTCRFGLEFIYA